MAEESHQLAAIMLVRRSRPELVEGGVGGFTVIVGPNKFDLNV